jgi:hypothetical protein
MVKVYKADEVDFTNSVIGEVEPLTGECHQKINGLETLTIELPYSLSNEIHPDRILEVDGQFFRILRLTSVGNDKEILHVYGESLFATDMLDDAVDSLFLEDEPLISVLTTLLDDTIYSVGPCSLILVSIAGTSLSKAAIINQLLDPYHLELNVEGLQIGLVEQIGDNRLVEFHKDKNLKSREIEEDISSVVTKLIYTNTDGSYGNELISSNVTLYAKPKTHYAVFDGKTSGETDLMALEFLEANDKPKVMYKVEFADLYYTKEYEQLKELEKVSLGDTITIIHEVFGIHIPVRIIELNRDIATRKNTKVVLGNIKSSFFDFQASLQETKDVVSYAFNQRKLNAATLKGLKIVDTEKDEITFEVTEEGNVKISGDTIIGGTLDANKVRIINFTADSGDVYYLMADNARVTQMAVNEVITMMIEEGKDEYHFIHIHGEVQEWKSAYRRYDLYGVSLPDEQLTDSFGNLLYWTEGIDSAITKEATDSSGVPLLPVMTHPYDYETKMEIKFDDVQLGNGTYTKAPVIWLGEGTGDGLNGRGKILKGIDGLELNYFSSINGDLRQLLLDDKGVKATPAFMIFASATNATDLSGTALTLSGINVTCYDNTIIAFYAQIDIQASEELYVTAGLRVAGTVLKTTKKKYYKACEDQLVFNGVLPKLIPATSTIDLILTVSNGTIIVAKDKYQLLLTIRGGEAEEAAPWPVININQYVRKETIIVQMTEVKNLLLTDQLFLLSRVPEAGVINEVFSNQVIIEGIEVIGILALSGELASTEMI